MIGAVVFAIVFVLVTLVSLVVDLARAYYVVEHVVPQIGTSLICEHMRGHAQKKKES